jgi:hypothetical protein
MQPALRRTSLTWSDPKMILVTYKSDAHPEGHDARAPGNSLTRGTARNVSATAFTVPGSRASMRHDKPR